MLMNVTVKMPPQMKATLEKMAEKEFTTVSGLLKRAAEKLLQEQGIDWRKEPEKRQKK
jgi:Arc/MetJ-type ribon-helix-helix transcriptional regulator